MNICGVKVKTGEKVKFTVKSLPSLLDSGWTQAQSGGLKKEGVFYRFTKKKMSSLSQVMEGRIILNPKGKTSVQAHNGWSYDESMINYIVPMQSEFQSCDAYIGDLTFEGDRGGNIYITDAEGLDTCFNKYEAQELLTFLLNYLNIGE